MASPLLLTVDYQLCSLSEAYVAGYVIGPFNDKEVFNLPQVSQHYVRLFVRICVKITSTASLLAR
eukprot:2164232-Karenia_brevis.AAC.1